VEESSVPDERGAGVDDGFGLGSAMRWSNSSATRVAYHYSVGRRRLFIGF